MLKKFGQLLLCFADLRPYYFNNVNLGSGRLQSELVLIRTNLDDNGTFQCIAENRAGVAVANFTLSVVVPVPPAPPQDVVGDRFQKEYLIAIGVAAVIVGFLTTIIVILLTLKCRRGTKQFSGQKSRNVKVHLYQNSTRYLLSHFRSMIIYTGW